MARLRGFRVAGLIDGSASLNIGTPLRLTIMPFTKDSYFLRARLRGRCVELAIKAAWKQGFLTRSKVKPVSNL